MTGRKETRSRVALSWNILLALMLSAAAGWAQDPVYQTGFEPDEGFEAGPHTAGTPIDNDTVWSVVNGTANILSIPDSMVYADEQSLEVEAQGAVQATGTGDSYPVVWLQGVYRTTPRDTLPSLSGLGASSALLFFYEADEINGIMVYNGTEGIEDWELVPDVTVGAEQWYLITIMLDFTTHTWDIYVGTEPTPKQSGIGFMDPTLSTYNGFRCSAHQAAGYLDNFYVGTTAPANLNIPTFTPTRTATKTPTATTTPTPTHTLSPTETPVPPPTNTPTLSPTITATPTVTATSTVTRTPTATATVSPTVTPTAVITPRPTPPQVIHLSTLPDPAEGPVGMEIEFRASAQSGDDNTCLVQYGWAYENPETLSATTALDLCPRLVLNVTGSHVYDSPGVYEYAFWVWDSAGQPASATGQVNIWAPVPTETPVEGTPTPTPTGTPSLLPGDTNSDGKVDAFDIFIFSLYWHRTSGDFFKACNVVEDSSGVVDANDLIWLLYDWRGIPHPEPPGW